ncbi:efflux RND transporter periplasmic adaptor subunit [Ferrimonas lipolytica]|uniref:Efflux RND transporter periplasmic adaptor subunit n=1 Tax=Ferrimonas lipolytica TaxID=2724191 RepID=A0A6H1UC17_9GAMM|nr:efflux RND transporter periplasmic adaptor subunit [Ferrimonas lipolytica]QIZ76637.1 efflux RND transporter periplasmic adaptor subunit [Ferrimonas lipolytica]
MKTTDLSAVTLVALVMLTGCDAAAVQEEQQALPRPVKLHQVQVVQQHHNRLPAIVASHKPADLAFRVSGVLTELALIEGQRVEQGQLLAQLDQRDASQALLNAQANYELAELDHQRNLKLLSKSLISKAEVDVSKAQLKSSHAALEMAENQLEYTDILAPFSGVVAKVFTENFQMVQATQVILTLQRDNLIELKAQIPESLLLHADPAVLSAQLRASASFDADQRHHPLRYLEHSSVVTSGSQSFEMTFVMEPPRDLNVVAGMSAEIEVNFDAFNAATKATVVVPQNAVEFSDGVAQSQVWVFDAHSQQVSPRLVTIGSLSDQGVEILSGLAPGTLIVETGVSILTPEQQVKPLVWPRGI